MHLDEIFHIMLSVILGLVWILNTPLGMVDMPIGSLEFRVLFVIIALVFLTYYKAKSLKNNLPLCIVNLLAGLLVLRIYLNIDIDMSILNAANAIFASANILLGLYLFWKNEEYLLGKSGIVYQNPK